MHIHSQTMLMTTTTSYRKVNVETKECKANKSVFNVDEIGGKYVVRCAYVKVQTRYRTHCKLKQSDTQKTNKEHIKRQRKFFIVYAHSFLLTKKIHIQSRNSQIE